MAFPPEGTRYILPEEAQARAGVVGLLGDLYDAWGYRLVEVPALERYHPDHPRVGQSFKLSDRDSGVLALRSDFTPALAGLVRTHYPRVAAGEEEEVAPLRLRYADKTWQAIDPDVARTREFTQVGVELIGVSNARADAELIHLARESVRAVGLVPRVEIGNPAFVRALLDLAAVPQSGRGELADAIDRKDRSTLVALLADLAPPKDVAAALFEVPDLYGDVSVLEEARRVAPWPPALAELERLQAILGEFEDDSELLLDLGTARRLSYYTGVTFRAYTFDYGQPLLGGGRYDGALLPWAAGFTIGLERLLSAVPDRSEGAPVLVLSLDDVGARILRAAGYGVMRSLTTDVEAARQEARRQGIPYLLTEVELEPLEEAGSGLAELRRVLEEGRG